MRDSDVPVLRAVDDARAVAHALGQRWTHVPVAIEPSGRPPAGVRYRWDADTEILVARLLRRAPRPVAALGEQEDDPAPAGASLEIEGRDGSWLTLELDRGRICGVEVAVWPELRRMRLQPPAVAEVAHVAFPALRGAGYGGVQREVEVDVDVSADADPRERCFHFRLGHPRPARAVRVGRDILVDVDVAGELAGLWLLNVPPIPLPLA